MMDAVVKGGCKYLNISPFFLKRHFEITICSSATR